MIELAMLSPSPTIAGMDGEIDFETNKLVLAYNLMPQKVKDLYVASYKNIAPRIEKNGMRSFRYEGVTITPMKNSNGGTDLKFSYKGHTLVVNNYSSMEFDVIFGL